MAAQPHAWASHVEPAPFSNVRWSADHPEDRPIFPPNNLQQVDDADERSLIDRLAQRHPAPSLPRNRTRWVATSLRSILHWLLRRLVARGIVAAFVLIVIISSSFATFHIDWTRVRTAAATDHEAVEPALDRNHSGAAFRMRPLPVILRSDGEQQATTDALVPSLTHHAQPAASPWRATHRVAAGETLGLIAARYRVSALSLVWANNIAPDTLAIAQELRIPLRPGIPHTVGVADTLESIAERYAVGVTSVRYFAPNNLAHGRRLTPGEEIFVPDGHLAIGSGPVGPTELAAAQLTATPVGVVADDETNLRTGPGTAYDQIVQLSRGAVVKLQLKHQDWFKVEAVDGTRGWVSADLLEIAPDVAEIVPIAPSVPPLPAVEPVAASQPAQAEARVEPAEQPATAVEQPQTVSEATPVTKPEAPAAVAPAPKAAAAKPAAAKPSNRWVWPARGRVTSGFGPRKLRVSSYHNGVDIANRKWTPIVAARGGTVKVAGWCSGYGYCVVINHHDGFVTEYGHLAGKRAVRAGQKVTPGQLIGSMGSTYDREGGGYSTGVHLHFTIKRDGRAVNPLKYLP